MGLRFWLVKPLPNLALPQPKPKPLPRAKTKPKPASSAREQSSKTKLEAKGWGTKGETPLSLENKKKLDIIYAKGFVKTGRK